jgi:hypothetical protein
MPEQVLLIVHRILKKAWKRDLKAAPLFGRLDTRLVTRTTLT